VKPKFPATEFWKDVIRMKFNLTDMGKPVTRATIRANWKAGKYAGLRADWAKEWME